MFKKALLAMLGLEGASLLAFIYPSLAWPLLAAGFIFTVVASWKRFEWGVYILLGELFVGSRGHFLEVDLGFISLSLRLAIFLAVFIGAVKILTQNPGGVWRGWRDVLPKSFWLLVLLVAAGIINGLLAGPLFGNVFLDANGYFYLVALPFLFLAVRDRGELMRILDILGAAVLVIAAQTLAVFLWFRLDLPGVATVYAWILGDEIGEITGHVGEASRIFLQSQFYSLVSVFIFAFFTSKPIYRLVFAAAVFTVLMSLSRSFWLGGAAAAAFSLTLTLFWVRPGRSAFLRLAGRAAALALIAGAVVYALFSFGRGSDARTLSGRIENPAQEAAGQARLLLLPGLLDGIRAKPLLGYGFGKELSYPSFLPDRMSAENPNGEIRTFAFEWGYLDLLLKLGLAGFLAYLWFVAKIFQKGFAVPQGDRLLAAGFLGGLTALAVLNVTTPYLNHPLGIGYLIFAFVSFKLMSEQTEESAASSQAPF